MLVKIGTYTLVGGTRATGMGVKWENFRTTRGVEVYYPIRGAAKTRDSGNDVTEVSFQVSREFVEIVDAEMFLADHTIEVPRNGVVQFVSKRENGQEVTRYLLDARVTSIELVQAIGVNLTHRYSFVGGAYTKIKPT